MGIFFIIKYTGITKILNNLQEIKKLIQSAGFWSYSVFAALQFLQVTILPLPASVTTIAGVIIFGPLTAFVISTLAVILGSLFAYMCGRFCGEKLLKNFEKYKNIEKFKLLLKTNNLAFFIMMLFPLFPDDILCLIAGITGMDFKFFLITNLITRPLGIFCICFLSSWQLIPFKSLRISVWICVVLICVFCGIVYAKNKEKLHKIISLKIKRK